MIEPYALLGISSDASDAEVEAAYKRSAQLYHPDRYASMSSEVHDEAERRMKELNAARQSIRESRARDRTPFVLLECPTCSEVQQIAPSHISLTRCKKCGSTFTKAPPGSTSETSPEPRPSSWSAPAGARTSNRGSQTPRSQRNPSRARTPNWAYGILAVAVILVGVGVGLNADARSGGSARKSSGHCASSVSAYSYAPVSCSDANAIFNRMGRYRLDATSPYEQPADFDCSWTDERTVIREGTDILVECWNQR
jgi:hypothetical protein